MVQTAASMQVRQSWTGQVGTKARQGLSNAGENILNLPVKKASFDLSEAMSNPFGEHRATHFRGNDYY